MFLCVSLVSNVSAAVLIDIDDIIDVVDIVTSFVGTNALAPSSKKELDDSRESRLIINSNVRNADIYLNGVYKGKTNLILKNLRPGKYKLELKKDFYECDTYTITVKTGYELTYDVQMKELQGTFNFSEIPSDAKIYIDNSRFWSKVVNIIAGYHDIKITRFGFETFGERFYLEPYKNIVVRPKFKEVPFELSNFASSREYINPDVKGTVGKTKITFNVTNKGSADLLVFGPDGTMTNNYKFETFDTWEQSYVWKGYSDSGEKLGEGLYWFELNCDGKKYETSCAIDYSITYPVMNNTPAGFGYGKTPAFEKSGLKFGNVSVAGMPVFENGIYSGTFINTELAGSFGDHFAAGLSLKTGIDFTDDDVYGSSIFPFMISGNLRLTNQFKLDENIAAVGGIIRYGFADDMSKALAADYGAGLGFGFLLGLNTKNTSTTASLQYVLGSETGIISEGKNQILAGLALAVKPIFNLSFYADGQYCINRNYLDFGAGTNWLIFGSGLMLNAGFRTVYEMNKGFSELSANAGITLVF